MARTADCLQHATEQVAVKVERLVGDKADAVIHAANRAAIAEVVNEALRKFFATHAQALGKSREELLAELRAEAAEALGLLTPTPTRRMN